MQLTKNLAGNLGPQVTMYIIDEHSKHFESQVQFFRERLEDLTRPDNSIVVELDDYKGISPKAARSRMVQIGEWFNRGRPDYFFNHLVRQT